MPDHAATTAGRAVVQNDQRLTTGESRVGGSGRNAELVTPQAKTSVAEKIAGVSAAAVDVWMGEEEETEARVQ